MKQANWLLTIRFCKNLNIQPLRSFHIKIYGSIVPTYVLLCEIMTSKMCSSQNNVVGRLGPHSTVCITVSVESIYQVFHNEESDHLLKIIRGYANKLGNIKYHLYSISEITVWIPKLISFKNIRGALPLRKQSYQPAHFEN